MKMIRITRGGIPAPGRAGDAADLSMTGTVTGRARLAPTLTA